MAGDVEIPCDRTHLQKGLSIFAWKLSWRPSHKRVVEGSLTEKGARMIELAPEPLQAGFLREFRKLERWEQHQLIGSMQRIAVLMDAEDIDASPILVTGEVRLG